MNSTKRIVVNTIAQYSRSIINMGLALFTTRIVISALGLSDYGIYTVVGGVVAMLGFITNALVLTTQRYISYYHGKGSLESVTHVFKNSFVLHLIIALGISLVLIALKIPLLDHYLVIEEGRSEAAHFVYWMTALILFLTIMVAPLKALFIARENIVYISVVEVCEYAFKLLLVLWIMGMEADKLVLYATMMASVHIINFLAYLVYAFVYYPECNLHIRRKDVDGRCFRALLGFAGWNTYGVGVGIVRQQGIALLLNRFMGTVINSAYGISFQVYGAVAFVASSILNAMNPQIMKAEGAGNRSRVLYLAALESKYAVVLMMIFVIPMSVVMPQILDFWLEEVPEYASMFCIFVLITSMLDNLTIGLNSAQQALGNLREYSLLLYTPKLLVPVFACFFLYAGYDLVWIMWVYLLLELLPALGRIAYFRWRLRADFDTMAYFRTVLLPLIPLAFWLIAVSHALNYLCNDLPFGFVIVVGGSVPVGLGIIGAFVLNKSEKQRILDLVWKKVRKETEL